MDEGDKFIIKHCTTPPTYIPIEVGKCGIFIGNDHISTTELLSIIRKRNNGKVKLVH